MKIKVVMELEAHDMMLLSDLLNEMCDLLDDNEHLENHALEFQCDERIIKLLNFHRWHPSKTQWVQLPPQSGDIANVDPIEDWENA